MWKCVLYTFTISVAAKNLSQLDRDIALWIAESMGKVNSSVSTPDTFGADKLSQLDRDIALWIAESTRNDNQTTSGTLEHKKIQMGQRRGKISTFVSDQNLMMAGFKRVNPLMSDFNLNSRGEISPQDDSQKLNHYEKGTKNIMRMRSNNAINSLKCPYLAAVIINGKFLCAGTLVNENWVLTVAHCLSPSSFRSSYRKSLGMKTQVRLGSVHPNEGGQLVSITRIVKRPDNKEKSIPQADVALLQLSRRMYDSIHIHSLKINEDIKMPLSLSLIEIADWRTAKTSEDETKSKEPTPEMNSAQMEVGPYNYCVDAYQFPDADDLDLTANFFCATMSDSSKDICLFDSGAPAVQNHRLMGIMTFGPKRCGQGFQPAVFIKPLYFRKFVQDTISKFNTTNMDYTLKLV